MQKRTESSSKSEGPRRVTAMRLIWGSVITVFQLCLWVNCHAPNRRPFSHRGWQTPEDILARHFTSNSVRQAFSIAKDAISARHSIIDGRSLTPDPKRDVPSARHQHFQGIHGRAALSESLQELFEEGTKILLDRFNLTPGQIISSVADLLNILQGDEVQSCESQFNFSCNRNSRYRNFDGTCNNLRNPSWGMAAACFERLVDPDYADGTSAKRVSVSGNPLPPPRTISLEIHDHLDNPTKYITHMFMVYGQFLDHDISLSPVSQGPNNQPLECCPVNDGNPQCDPILLGSNDPFFSPLGINCLNNVRSAMCSTCSLGPRQQINQVTSYIDASHIYGFNLAQSSALRNNDGSGTMRSTNSTVGGELLPPSFNPNEDSCSFQDPILNCFETGDQRSNQHPALTSMHTLFLREHNRIARRLRELNRNWDGERIYQEARRIVAAIMQMITYNEFLPLVIGPENMKKYDLYIQRNGYTQYDDTVQATLVNEFSTAAFRFGHSMINSFFPQLSRGSSSNERLRDIFQYPFGLHRGELEGLIRGTTLSPSQTFDRYMVKDVTNHLYQTRGNTSGLDLAAININRGRDHGIPGYTTLVDYCGGSQIRNWRQLDGIFQRRLSSLFQRLYEDVRDIDLFSGGLAERPVLGAVIGPTFTCIVGIQFYHLKYGDRFYFEHGGQTGSFTPAQLAEIKKVTLGKLICQNSNIDQIQAKVMLYKSNINPVVNCDHLPEMNLRVWR
ncbi:peroxidase-like [Parasteatoda tepidariorum]|uniref:peroxidase-like n=1 Tax=Parasteatoda tepidariorum TaxID=114398 RepID=UPI00077FC37D|nr:peroxidase-like [Parasteatoda tepidariorum]